MSSMKLLDAFEVPGLEPVALVAEVERLRVEANQSLNPAHRAALGQFMTPAPIARRMAAFFKAYRPHLRLLDAGAGVGSLTAAWVAEMLSRPKRPKSLSVTAYEVDPTLVKSLRHTMELCRRACERYGMGFESVVHSEDFIEAGVSFLDAGLFARARPEFDCAILNPPYRKINTGSRERLLLESIGAGTSNLYTGFLSVVVRLLVHGGEMVAITPRSFCNGPYFRPFRADFLSAMALQELHVFDSRKAAFSGDDVLQENVIIHAVKGPQCPRVTVSSSSGAMEGDATRRQVPFHQVVRSEDSEQFIRLATDELDDHVAARLAALTHSLSDLGLTISTGRVVDFRVREYLRPTAGPSTVPLIWPGHLSGGFVAWPRDFKKPNALVVAEETAAVMVPAGTYVLVKRFSSKEEKRRVVAAVFDTAHVPCERVGFENHLNYFHQEGCGLPDVLARGLAAFLNSTLLDAYFRQLSGHTQVNAGDLRNLKYPSRQQLEAVGRLITDSFPAQENLDALLEKELFAMADVAGPNPLLAMQKIQQAMGILKDLGMPKTQTNERSALTLLALLDLGPNTPWNEASSPMMGISPMLDFMSKRYGKQYAPNTRESVRRSTIHQFKDAGLVAINPDDPTRATNSDKTVYQVLPPVLELVRTFGTQEWTESLRDYLSMAGTLREKYAQARSMNQLAVTLPDGDVLKLSPGGQNKLVKHIVEQFCPRYTPGGRVLYVGDTQKKHAVYDKERLATLGVKLSDHGKMPDVVALHEKKGWLLLIEAVTSHGPVDPKRRLELRDLFKDSSAGLIYVTAFENRKVLKKYLTEISYETEVWTADEPDHLIHFNGERFLGPYPEKAVG
ncbi:BsuBI/PstI family type II restriction endonuclease [Myxococcus xanthus]|uniref:site-specific DNA-methyltransferase (adenine-specific) n=1 Tax=Myxococcus xanthus TaxID=34 RepID=A0A7Y4MU80_MYXXA|nr:BsuBI/PstI family type II restriction endonuclease [Myxococcus xanthus]NOJ82335.1 adenine methyltransferase [Myxococcus xanthus]NOJ89828.1 adenine methyltransferase [Myxococcus xanthus]